ncbi:MFS transporter [Kocuria dechangensis]|uniref:MFS transporter n=1 Tax=Kocuria dechangensis TaxID=1176249 RepID=A0A917GKL3_9MICC|nr:MFS transporter [Kocuria dechangensis]GGG49324.1 MFS transporter [Kocuria dechangensis]
MIRTTASPPPASPSSPGRVPWWLVVSAVVLVAVNLRPGASSIGPVLAELQRDLDLSATVAGALTALPGLTFAVAGACAVALSRRTGIGGAIACGLALVAAGLLGRSLVTSAPVFLALSVLALIGMGIGNILVPAFVKRHGGERTAALNSVYTTGLAVGATLPLLAAGPLTEHGPGGWRSALGLWGLAAVAAFGLWVVVAARDRREAAAGTRVLLRDPRTRITRSRTAVALALYFGIQSMHAYVQFGWIAQIYRDGGLDQTQAGLMTALLAAMGIPGGLLMPAVVARSQHLRTWVVVLGACMSAGYVGLLLAPSGLPWLWALLLGVGCFSFPTALALIVARSRDAHVTAQLSGFTQPVGYLLAAAGPFAVGALHELTGGWTVPLVALAASGVILIGAGLVAAAPRFVDDELAGRPGTDHPGAR